MVSLKKAFEMKIKDAERSAKVNEVFSHALADSKYSELDELPDEVVDAIDYGTSSMTYEEFKELMDEALSEQNG